jgi:hypothetical protein
MNLRRPKWRVLRFIGGPSVIVALMAIGLVSGQEKSRQDSEIAELRIQQLLVDMKCKKTDEGYQLFREWLKKGARGDGVHHPWMDKMRQFGVRQASLEVHSSWKQGAWRYKVERIEYFRLYYCDDSLAIRGRLLNDIRSSGLEQQLKEAIVAKIKTKEQPLRPEQASEQRDYRYLLDDEYLPIVELIH